MSTHRRSGFLIGLIAAFAAAPAQAAPSSTPVAFPNVDGSVRAVLIDGRTAYIGGHFSSVGAPSGPLAFLDPRMDMRATGGLARFRAR